MAISKWRFLFLGIFAAFTSCQVVRYVGINNYEEPRQIIVHYMPHDDIIWESDTLNLGAIGVDTFTSVLIRRNIDSLTYTFQLPENTHAELMPKGTLNPFSWIKIINGPDTTFIDLQDKSTVKRLKRDRVIETSGIPESMFLINIGKPK